MAHPIAAPSGRDERSAPSARWYDGTALSATTCSRRAANADAFATIHHGRASIPRAVACLRSRLVVGEQHRAAQPRRSRRSIDTGYVRHAALTLALLASDRGIGAAPLAWIVNTHCHSDHIGGNAAIAAKYGCPIAVPAGEAPLVERWDAKALLYDYCDQRADRFTVDQAIAPDTTHVWGDLEWRALAAPGHDMGALVFYNDEHGS